MDEGARLYDLFMALFHSDAELRRFFVLEGYQLELLAPSSKSGSLSETAYEAAGRLDKVGLIDRALFAALERRSPARSQDIRAVAGYYGVLGGTAQQRPVTPGAPPVRAGVGKTPDPADLPAELAEFARQLQGDLDALQPPDPGTRATDPDHWPWTAAAAVLGSFSPTRLRPIAGVPRGQVTALVALAESVHTSSDGSWFLQDGVRSRCLRRLRDEHGLERALEANAHLPDRRRDAIRELLRGRKPALAQLDPRELEDLDVVIGWLEPLGVDLPVSGTSIRAAAERRLLIDPLRALVGTHFRGRTEQLATIRNHIKGEGREPVLLVQGPGGAGKTSLVGKVLLDLEDRAVVDPVSFAYIDFDKARHDPRNPVGLLEQVARQLRLLYATSAEASHFAAFESVAGGTDLERAAEVLDIAPGLDLSRLIEALAKRLLTIHNEYGRPGSAPLVLVLDTLEEVQAKGPGAVADLHQLLDRLQEALPGMRVIVSGRAVVWQFGAPGSVVRLGDLEAAAADAVLAHLGIGNEALRQLIVQRFGGNPLTLRLAAEALARMGTADRAFDGVVARADALAEVASEQVQGMLYSRILGHIGQPEVVKVAHPGLAVRLVTVGVLREVLAVPCELDPDRAEEIFELLRREVSMFELVGPDTLRHRQDIRRLMLRTMLDEPVRAKKVAEIHSEAAAYYHARDGLDDRAEELYHRLMSGEDPRLLGRLWSSELRDRLVSAMEEPLPPRARTWLGRRLGLVPSGARDEWDQDDWEADAASRASSWLASRNPARAMAVLAERPERMAGSQLYALEVAASVALGDLTHAQQALDQGMLSAIDCDDHVGQLGLAEQAITLRARQGDGPGIVEAARSAVALADLTGQGSRGILALAAALALLRDMDLDGEAATLSRELSGRFTQLSQTDLRTEPELVRRVLHTAGTTDTGVLLYAAAQVGDQTSAVDGVFRPDSLVLARLLQQTSSAASTALTALAVEVGLLEDDWSAAELARRAVRIGRTGIAVALGLNYARDEDAARRLVVNDLVRPINLS